MIIQLFCDTTEFCAENVITKKTASDYGVYDLSVDEFNNLTETLGSEAEKIYALTPLQEGMLFYNIESVGSTSYILQHVFRMRTDLDTDVLNTALMLLSERYEVLKTAVIYENIPEPKQAVYAKRKPELNVIHIDNEEEFPSYVEADINRGFRLDKDTLLRVTVLSSADKCCILWTIHHIISDGWCSEQLFGALLKYYDMLSGGTASVDDIKAQIAAERAERGEYSDYIDWITKQNTEKAKAYWRKLLRGYENDTRVTPIEKPEPSEKHMERMRKTVGLETTAKLMSIAENCQSTINNVSEVACGILLQRYTRSDDVVFGKVVSGRNAPIRDIENIVGLFVNTIPVRVSTADDLTVNELVKRQQKQGMESTEYDFCSLAEIQGMTQQGTDLINVLYVFENYASGTQNENEDAAETADDAAFDVEATREQTNYPISISGYTTKGELGFDVKYDPNEFCKNEIELFLERLKNICVQMADDPQRLVSSISEATDKEKSIIIDTFNDTQSPYPDNKTLVEMFEEQAAKTPDSAAVVYKDESISYTQLNAKANALALKLRELGVQPDDFVAIIADRSIQLVQAVYGVLKSGGAYVPIDPTYPSDRISYMIDDCKPKAVIVYTKENVELPENTAVIDLGSDNIGEIADNPPHVNKSSDLAYCIYTSGTTGRPKGVVLENRSVVNHLTVMREKFYTGGSAGDTPLFTSFAFDFTVPAIFGTLLFGDKLAVMDDISDLVRYSENSKLAVLKITPSYFNSIYDSFTNHKGQVGTVVFGGETLTPETIRNVRSAFGDSAVIFNEYGPTEATVFTSAAQIIEGERITIGKPAANSKLFVMNGNRFCGIGIAGELCIAGVGLARGYLNQPEMTAEKFVDIPFAQDRMYRSGDLARWLPDGNIEYLGRIDEQVKIRGFRVELGEIENRIRELEFIKDSAVVARETSDGTKAIYAYYTSSEAVEISRIRERLGAVLPHYMVPSYMMQIEQIPVTQNGKLDRAALPDIVIKSEKEFIPPETKAEKDVCAILCSVLSLEKVSLNDNFFEIGGDSLKAIRIISRLREIGYDVSVYNMMKHNLIKQFTDEAAAASRGDERTAEHGIIPDNAYISGMTDRHYVHTFTVETEAADKQTVDNALNTLVQRHGALRVSVIDGKPVIAEADKPQSLASEWFDLSDNPRSSDEFILSKSNELKASVNAAGGAVIKAAVIKLGERMKVLIAVDSLIFDIRSMKIIIEELLALIGGSQELGDTTNSLIRWSSELNSYQNSDIYPTSRRYWSDKMPELTRLYLMGEASVSERVNIRFTLDLGSEEDKEKINSAFNTDVKELMLAAMAQAQARVTGEQRNVVLYSDDTRGTTDSGADYTRTAGRMSTAYPVVIEDRSSTDELIITNKESLNSVPNNGMEFGMEKEFELDSRKYAALSYLGEIQTANALKPVIDLENDSPIAVLGYICGNKLEVTVSGEDRAYAYGTADSFAQEYRNCLENILDYCRNKDEKVFTASDFDSSMDMEDLGGILDILNGRDLF